MRLLVILLCLTTCFACKDEKGMTISEEKITAMMGDMLLAEAAINRVNRNESDSISALYYQQIYTIHDVDSAEFAYNLEMVSKDPNLSATIYKAVEDRMSGKLTSIKEAEEKEKEEKMEKKGDKKDKNQSKDDNTEAFKKKNIDKPKKN